jgi:hypothetical protein
VTVGIQALNTSLEEANRDMKEFAAELKLISDAMQEHEGF